MGFAILASQAALCQKPAARPAFDIADVHVSPRADWAKAVVSRTQSGPLSGDRYQLRRVTLLDLIKAAYNVDADKILGGPTWIDYDRFEVAARTKPGTRQEILRLMLQTLLADRFHLVLKTEMQNAPGYNLSKGTGNLKFSAAADGSASTGCQTTPHPDAWVTNNNVQCRNVTMAEFAFFLRGFVARLPVLDSTGLDGGWDIDLQYATRKLSAMGTPDAAVIDEVEKMGLKLEPGQVPQPVLKVESADEQPSPNPPGVAEALPPLPPPEFEVASIRQSDHHGSQAPRFEPGGRVTATGMSPAFLITRAWNQPPMAEIPGMPKALLSGKLHNITIVAKAPAGIDPDEENLNAMMRALLIERYKMAVHYEERPMDAETLVAVKPKLAKADPAGRTGCAARAQSYPGQGAVVHVDCRNMTMAQFAEQIQGHDPTILYPVLDGTGIDGAWDFTFTYGNLTGHRTGLTSAYDKPGEAPDMSGVDPFAVAIQKQLGLKLEVQKRPEQVLVIDHMEEKPTEN